MSRVLRQTLGLFVAVALMAGFGNDGSAAPRLADQPSPYLQLHRNDPVDWRPWGPDIFAEAKQAQKPIMLSLGYLACHWCHVLQAESFTNDAIAKIINEMFIPVLVDREERPEIDQIYQHAALLMGSQTGWPLNVFLSPDGTPFFAVGYLPPEPRQGLPAFSAALAAVAETYREQQNEIAALGAAVKREMGKRSRPAPGDPSGLALNVAVRQIDREIDVFNGGVGTAPKFPRLPTMETLWRGYLRTNAPALRDSVAHALASMAQGGLYDHLAGGFARYATDPEWRIPHFEKMLDINAQFLSLMADVWRETHSPLLAARLRESVAFLLAEMRLPGGAFAAAIDSDSEGREGAFYVWTAAEIERVLGRDAALFKRAYGVTADGNWENGVSVLYRTDASAAALAKEFGGDETAVLARLAGGRQKLKTHRDQRPRPMRDGKVLADWNGAMIAGLAEASLALDEPAWLNAAEGAFAFVETHLDGGQGLRHSWSSGKAGLPATLDGYAHMSRAAVTLFEATGKTKYLAAAQRWIRAADALWDEANGGYYMATRDDHPELPMPKLAIDSGLPAGNGVMADAAMRLYHLVGDPVLRVRAERTVGAFFGGAMIDPVQSGGILNAADTVLAAVQIVIVGDRTEEGARKLLHAAWRTAIPGRVLQVVPPGAVLPEAHPARFKNQEDGKATAYVCVGTVCSLPTTASEDMIETMLAMRAARVSEPAIRVTQ
ncbi:MAG: thioredoxin domain-containing protein [Rhodospirillales bacterium]|nr:thioredoxin domain-containing protein [Rhodospirillales bacterium]